MLWRTISWIAGAYRRRSSADHAVCRLLGPNDRSVRTAGASDQDGKPINALAFGQGLIRQHPSPGK
jgi:hypothetical protein